MLGAGLLVGLILLASQTVATFYGPYFSQGEHLMSNGEVYRDDGATAAVALWAWPQVKGRWLRVTSLETGRRVWVRVTDTCPGCRGWHIDLPDATWEKLGLPLSRGVAKVKVEMLR